MFSNTENNSASDKVNTRPRLKAYLGFMSWVKSHEIKIATAFGYLLVATLFFGLGKYSATNRPPAVRVEEPTVDLTQIYNNLKPSGGEVAGEEFKPEKLSDCEGKIKGNISSRGKIYHLPGGASYKRTVPEMCFETETEAQTAGFRKAKR